MFRKALIAVDLDSISPLLGCASDLLTWGVDRLLLVHLMPVGYLQGPSYGEEDRYRERLKGHAAAMRASGFTVEVQVETSGDVGGELATLASDAHADLLVIGSRSQNLLQKLFLGSVARKVLRQSTVPVLLQWIEPKGLGPDSELRCTQTLRQVLLATDLTPGSAGAEEAAVQLATRGAKVDCVHIAEPKELERSAAWETTALAALGVLNERIIAAGGSGEYGVEAGDPMERLLELGSGRDASLLVIGKRGRRWPEQLTIGSTAEGLSQRSHRPLLMVPGRPS